jgi:hypothetical protein
MRSDDPHVSLDLLTTTESIPDALLLNKRSLG